MIIFPVFTELEKKRDEINAHFHRDTEPQLVERVQQAHRRRTVALALLAAEITAATGKDPAQHYEDIVAQYGRSYYQRIDSPASPEQKAALLKLNPDAIAATTLAGDPITAKLTNAPGNNAPIGGLKVVTERGWFAVRPSGTENISKVYAESLVSEAHLKQIQQEATAILNSLN